MKGMRGMFRGGKGQAKNAIAEEEEEEEVNQNNQAPDPFSPRSVGSGGGGGRRAPQLKLNLSSPGDGGLSPHSQSGASAIGSLDEFGSPPLASRRTKQTASSSITTPAERPSYRVYNPDEAGGTSPSPGGSFASPGANSNAIKPLSTMRRKPRLQGLNEEDDDDDEDDEEEDDDDEDETEEADETDFGASPQSQQRYVSPPTQIQQKPKQKKQQPVQRHEITRESSMSNVKAKHIEQSAGTERLNRILNKSTHGRSSGGDHGHNLGLHDLMESDLNTAIRENKKAQEEEVSVAVSSTARWKMAVAAVTGGGDRWSVAMSGMVATKVDPRNLIQVAKFVAQNVLPPIRVDPRSIGGSMLDGYPSDMRSEVLLVFPCQQFESNKPNETVSLQALQFPGEYAKHKRSLGLLGSGSAGAGPGTSGGGKGRNKLRFVVLARSTNKPLLNPGAGMNPHAAVGPTRAAVLNQQASQQRNQSQSNMGSSSAGGGGGGDESEKADYETMFAGDEDDSLSKDLSESSDTKKKETAPTSKFKSILKAAVKSEKEKEAEDEPLQINVHAGADEVSSFPVLLCMTLHADGTAPDIRKLISLDQLTTVQDLQGTVVQLAFTNGDTIRLDFLQRQQDSHHHHLHHSAGGAGGGGKNSTAGSAASGAPSVPQDKTEEQRTASMEVKERFIWSLLQIHAMLCMSVVERNAMQQASTTRTTTSSAAAAAHHRDRMYLPPLNVRNLDRAELQYVATVKQFLANTPILVAMLERQRKIYAGDVALLEATNAAANGGEITKKKEESKEGDVQQEMDEMAYDLLMGNFTTRVALFHSEEERKDAEDVLNSTEEWTRTLDPEQQQAAATMNIGERLAHMLQWRMRDLEAETCRRLIAWEDEKHLSTVGNKTKLHGKLDDRDSVDALALASLFKTLESLDTELQSMEEWLQERAAAIKPLTDDCADIEEENRQLEQQWKSYDMLGAEMHRLLQGLEINDEMERVLSNPASALYYNEEGWVDVETSENGFDQIYEAGRALQEAMEYPRRSGGLHLTAVNERLDGLQEIASGFCKALARIIVTIMEQFKTEVVAGSDHGKVSKSDTHTIIAKKVRDTQRKFQSALLGYIKLIEVLSALSPETLPALRDAYAEMVSEGILMKKRMKGYFQALPAKNVAYMYKAGKDLKDYNPSDDPSRYETVNAPDIRAALGDLLPVIAREAYFTSALFGSTTKESDGREKKRNFENTKAAVDSASQHFRYYLNRTCGIVSQDLESKSSHSAADASGTAALKYDPLLCVVASIYLNESMKNFIDREKKGGDHSLSLAYVRATILDLRKRADKQWVQWVDRQIAWIKSNDGVPLSGKRAGIFPSFARFACYLDHLMICCKEGREEDFVPDLPKIKVIAYYLQKMAATLLDSLRECAGRETTDRQYGENVMQMENCYFFTQAIKQRGEMMETLFATQVNKANMLCKESTDAYLGWMIKKEFAVLHELFSRASKLRKEVGDREVLKHIPKQQFVKTLTKEASRETLREKIGVMYSRMEKHLSPEAQLLPIAWKALVKVLYEWFGRWEKLASAVYSHKLNPSAVDVVRIAKAAGGGNTGADGGAGGRASSINTNNSNEFGFKSILALNKNNTT